MIGLRYTITDNFHYWYNDYLWFDADESSLTNYLHSFLESYLIEFNTTQKKHLNIKDILDDEIDFENCKVKVSDLFYPSFNTIEDLFLEVLEEAKKSYQLITFNENRQFEKEDKIAATQFYYIKKPSLSNPYFYTEDFSYFLTDTIEENLLNMEIFLEDMKKNKISYFYIGNIQFEVDYFFDYGFFNNYNPFNLLDINNKECLMDFFSLNKDYLIKISKN